MEINFEHIKQMAEQGKTIGDLIKLFEDAINEN